MIKLICLLTNSEEMIHSVYITPKIRIDDKFSLYYDQTTLDTRFNLYYTKTQTDEFITNLNTYSNKIKTVVSPYEAGVNGYSF